MRAKILFTVIIATSFTVSNANMIGNMEPVMTMIKKAKRPKNDDCVDGVIVAGAIGAGYYASKWNNANITPSTSPELPGFVFILPAFAVFLKKRK